MSHIPFFSGKNLICWKLNELKYVMVINNDKENVIGFLIPVSSKEARNNTLWRVLNGWPTQFKWQGCDLKVNTHSFYKSTNIDSKFHFISQFQAILGKIVSRPSILDKELVQELVNASRPGDGFQVVSGKTMCTQDFYEGKHDHIYTCIDAWPDTKHRSASDLC